MKRSLRNCFIIIYNWNCSIAHRPRSSSRYTSADFRSLGIRLIIDAIKFRRFSFSSWSKCFVTSSMSPDRYAKSWENSNGAEPSLQSSNNAQLQFEWTNQWNYQLETVFSDWIWTYPAENISISGSKWVVLLCSFCCIPSIMDADSNELPPIKIFFPLFASDENDLTNLSGAT